MVLIDASSSVPPHIQPPIAQVPSAMRDTLNEVPGIATNSMVDAATFLFISPVALRAIA